MEFQKNSNNLTFHKKKNKRNHIFYSTLKSTWTPGEEITSPPVQIAESTDQIR